MPNKKNTKINKNYKNTKINNNNNNNNILNIENRKSLREKCKKYNIKGNISNADMIKCINLVEAGKKIPYNFKKKTWVELNKTNIIITSIVTLAISTLAVFSYFRKCK